jgi:hypothetical protein
MTSEQKRVTHSAITLSVFDMAYVTMPRPNLPPFSLVPISLT